MNFSKLNKRIKFIFKSIKRDDDGYPTENDVIIKSCWASIRHLRGKDFFESAKEQQEGTIIVNCRYFNIIYKATHIKYNDKLYKMLPPNDILEKHEEFEIYATEVV